MSLKQYLSASLLRCRLFAAALLTFAFLLAPLAPLASQLNAGSTTCERKCCKNTRAAHNSCCKRNGSSTPAFAAPPACHSCCHTTPASPLSNSSLLPSPAAYLARHSIPQRLLAAEAPARRPNPALDRTRFQRPPPALS